MERIERKRPKGKRDCAQMNGQILLALGVFSTPSTVK